MAVWEWAKGDPTTVSTRQREHIISTRTTTQPRSSDGGAEGSGAALAADTPFGSDRPDPYAELDDPRKDDETSALPSWALPQVATVLAGAGAAATSTLVGGHLGVAGTVVGAAVASIVTNLALNLYDNTLKRVTHQVKTKVVHRRSGEDPTDPVRDTATQGASGSTPAQPWRRRPLSRKVIRWSIITALVSTLLGLGLMVGIERGTASQITPGTSQLAGTSERSSTATEQDSGTSDSGSTGSGTSGQSEVRSDTEVVAPSVAPTGAETIVPTEVPTPGASTGTGSDTTSNGTTSDGTTGTDGGTTTGGTTTGDGSTSGGTSGGTTSGGTSGGTTGGSGSTSGGTGTGSSGSTGTTP